MEGVKSNQLAAWFSKSCGIDTVRAVSLADRVLKECEIDRVIEFKEMVRLTPNVLNRFEIPSTLQDILHQKLSVCENKVLSTLSTHEVATTLLNMFPREERISEQFKERKINGYVLSLVNTTQQLHRWAGGFATGHECDALLKTVTLWQSSGVPPQYLDPALNGHAEGAAKAEDSSSESGLEDGIDQHLASHKRSRTPTQWFDPTKNGDTVQPHVAEHKRKLQRTGMPTSPASDRHRKPHVVTPPQQASQPPQTPIKRGPGRPRKHPKPTNDQHAHHHQEQSAQTETAKTQSSAQAIAALTTLQRQANTDSLDYTELTSSGTLATAIAAANDCTETAAQCLALATTLLQRAPPDLHFELLVGQGLLQFVLAQAGEGAMHARVAGSECRALLLTKETAQNLQKNYFAALDASDAKQRDATRAAYVSLIKALCAPLPHEENCVLPRPTLWPVLLPILRDTLRQDGNSRTTFPAAWQAATALLQCHSTAHEVSYALCAYELLHALVGRLQDTKHNVSISALGCLTEAIGLLTDQDLPQLYRALPPLARLLTESPTTGLTELIWQAAEFVEKLAARGADALTALAGEHIAIFEAFCSHLSHPATTSAELSALRCAARAILQLCEGADSQALASLLEHGLYGALFKILHALPAHVGGNTDIVLRALEGLHRLVRQVESIESQVHCDEPRTLRWKRVTRLASGFSGAASSGGDNGVPGAVKVLAGRLLVAARTLGVSV